MKKTKTNKCSLGNRPIRVLQFAAADETLGFLLPLIKALKADGFQVSAAARKSEIGPDPKMHDFEFYDLPITRRLNPYAIVKAVFVTARLLRRLSVDILQVHTYAGGIVGRLAGWLAGTPIVIYTAHGWLYTPETPTWKKEIIVATERIFSWITSHYFVISQEELDVGLRDKILRKENSTLALSVGIDCDKFDPSQVSTELRYRLRQELSIPENVRVIGFVGRIVEEKGVLELGQAFAQLHKENPNLRLLIVGSADLSGRDNTCLAKLQNQIKNDGCFDSVVFAGRRSDVRDILSICDIFVLPTYREGMPVSLLEAMSMGLPCIATDIPGCREEIVNGECGYIVPPREINPLRGRIKDLLDNPKLAERMGCLARKRVIELFSLNKVLGIQLTVYNQFRNTFVKV